MNWCKVVILYGCECGLNLLIGTWCDAIERCTATQTLVCLMLHGMFSKKIFSNKKIFVRIVIWIISSEAEEKFWKNGKIKTEEPRFSFRVKLILG